MKMKKFINAPETITDEELVGLGRAKSYGAQTIGTPDAGAMSMAYFFRGLAQDSSESN